MQRLLIAVGLVALLAAGTAWGKAIYIPGAILPTVTHFILLNQGGHISLNQGGSLGCNSC